MDRVEFPGQSVFVIDDEPGIIRLCARVLERVGFETQAFTNPIEALRIMQEQERTHLLLVDIRMPEMDGFQVIEQARQHHPDLAVVVMTGFGSVETAIEALHRGADELLLKPFGGNELVQSVRHALSQRQHKQDQMRLQALRPLFDISEALFTETNPKRLRALILNAVCGHLRCSHAEYYQVNNLESMDTIRKLQQDATTSGHELDRDQGEIQAGRLTHRLRLIGGLHYPDREVQPEKRRATGLSTEPIARRASQYRVALSLQVDGPGDTELKEMLVKRGLGCVMCAPVPVKPGNGIPGILLAARDLDELRFGEADLELFVILARQAAVAMENARLNEEMRAYIRQLEQSQRALIQAEKMAIAGRLTASIAHEINNPLQAVQNCLHLTDRAELPADERQSYLNLARGELERLMATVQRMLDFYRPTALDRKPVDINILISNLLTLLDKQLTDQNTTVKTLLTKNLPLVMAVSDQLQQVFLNVILNAVEAMNSNESSQTKGRLTIRTGLNPKNSREVEVLIEDNGPGISPQQRKQLFEPFISGKERGMGLGLAVSYGIITAHGGSLDLIEQSDWQSRGTCFRITIPISPDEMELL